MTASIVPTPPRLQPAARAAAVEEALSVLRHELRNKLSSVRNSVFYIRRRVEKSTDLAAQDPRVAQFFALVDAELDTCAQLLTGRTPKLDAGSSAPCAPLREVLVGLLGSLEVGEGVQVRWDEPPHVQVAATPRDLELAVFALVENGAEAVAPTGGTVTVEATLDGGLASVVVISSAPLSAPVDQLFRPFFSTKADRVGVGLKMARRLAAGWGGRLEIVSDTQSVRAVLAVPLAGAIP